MGKRTSSIIVRPVPGMQPQFKVLLIRLSTLTLKRQMPWVTAAVNGSNHTDCKCPRFAPYQLR
jgi:hypothetical protein